MNWDFVFYFMNITNRDRILGIRTMLLLKVAGCGAEDKKWLVSESLHTFIFASLEGSCEVKEQESHHDPCQFVFCPVTDICFSHWYLDLLAIRAQLKQFCIIYWKLSSCLSICPLITYLSKKMRNSLILISTYKLLWKLNINFNTWVCEYTIP